MAPLHGPLLLLLGLASCSAFYAEDEYVVELTAKTGVAEVHNSPNLWMVEYYAPWCGHCKKLAPEYSKAAKDLAKYSVKFGAVDGEKEKSLAAALMVQVQGFPTIVAYMGTPKHNPYTKKSIRMPALYSGKRTAKGIKSWAMRKMASFVTPIKDQAHFKEFSATASTAKTNIVGLFTSKVKSAPLYKSLSTDFHKRLSFIAVLTSAAGDDDDSTVDTVLPVSAGVDTFPALVVFTAGEDGEAHSKKNVYEGDLKDKAAITEFLDEFARDPADVAKEEAALLSGVKPTAELTPENFEKTVLESEEAWVVAFTADGKALESSGLTGWDNMHDSLHNIGLVRSGRVNCAGHTDAEEGFCKDVLHTRGKKGLPALVVYPAHKVKAAKAADYMGGVDVDDAAERAVDTIRNGMMPLPEAMDPQILDKFMMQAVQKKKVSLILLTKKEAPPAGLRSISAEFDGVANVGFVTNPSKATMGRFQVKSSMLPQLILMAPGQTTKDDKGEEKMNFQVVQYQVPTHGPMNFNNIAGFLHSVGLRKGAGAGGAKEPESASLEKRETGPVKQLTASNFEALCGKQRLCAIGVFDGGAPQGEANTMAEDLATLENIRDESNAAFRVMWLDGVCNAEAAAALGVENGMPSVVVFSPKKKVSANLVGSYHNKTVIKFLKGVLSGRQRTAPVRGEVKLVDQDCAEFHKAQAAAMEPEAPQDEADDMMAEILAEEAREKEELAAQLKAEKKARKEAVKKEKEEKVKAEEAEKEAAKAKARKKRRAKKKKKKAKAKKKKAKSSD